MKSGVTGHVCVDIKAPAEKVWQALTTPDIIKQYFFGTNAISDWKEGSPLIFKGEWQGHIYEDKGTIITVKPNQLFKYKYWSSMSGIEDKPENYVFVTYQLGEKVSGVTQLEITQENIPDEATRKHSEENWKKVMDGLKKLLEKQRAESL